MKRITLFILVAALCACTKTNPAYFDLPKDWNFGPASAPDSIVIIGAAVTGPEVEHLIGPLVMPNVEIRWEDKNTSRPMQILATSCRSPTLLHPQHCGERDVVTYRVFQVPPGRYRLASVTWYAGLAPQVSDYRSADLAIDINPNETVYIGDYTITPIMPKGQIFDITIAKNEAAAAAALASYPGIRGAHPMQVRLPSGAR